MRRLVSAGLPRDLHRRHRGKPPTGSTTHRSVKKTAKRSAAATRRNSSASQHEHATPDTAWNWWISNGTPDWVGGETVSGGPTVGELRGVGVRGSMSTARYALRCERPCTDRAISAASRVAGARHDGRVRRLRSVTYYLRKHARIAGRSERLRVPRARDPVETTGPGRYTAIRLTLRNGWTRVPGGRSVQGRKSSRSEDNDV
jgi:hypothetical protein